MLLETRTFNCDKKHSGWLFNKTRRISLVNLLHWRYKFFKRDKKNIIYESKNVLYVLTSQ